MTEIVVPQLGESVTEATVATWHKQAGDAVKKDEVLVELETDKVSLEVSARADGALKEIVANEGDTVEVGALLGHLEEGASGAASKSEDTSEAAQAKQDDAKATTEQKAKEPATVGASSGGSSQHLSPAPQRVVSEHKLDPSQIQGTGKDGRITKGDALKALESGLTVATPAASPERETGPREERVKMTRLRQTIARRLKDAQNTAAMLTTFNEVDLGAVMELRKHYKDSFQKRHGVKLGFMGFFTKACVAALQELPAINAEIDGKDIIYKNHYDIGIAVGTEKGLVVPVVRDCDRLSLAEIEKGISEMGRKARDGDLSLDDMQGGTFTITNGGVYGSLMSTPILNAPQSGILGMHKIQERPMAVNGQVEIRPMMYLALSYDHRIVDGKEAVTFLVRVKELLEDPARLVMDV